ncbi:MAG: DUF2520 domain-containing protein [Muribaculaceae bacterium]|nr:DUF2520 domain-containing protein [Muribaculaceae bacterium]
MKRKNRVVIIGSGGVATSVALALRDHVEIVQIFSRTLANAQRLAARVGCDNIVDNLGALDLNADAYLVMVTDDAIAEVLSQVPDNGALWVHTSGSTPLSVFEGRRRHAAVMWPLQSFSRERVEDMSHVYAFVEATSPADEQAVGQLAAMITDHVMTADSARRRQLHIAAVFACNFANHMFTLADDVLQRADIPFDAILPLIRTMVSKLDTLTPEQSQTGPAARGDRGIIADHLASLSGNEREIYDLLSRSILNHHNTKPK